MNQERNSYTVMFFNNFNAVRIICKLSNHFLDFFFKESIA